MNPVEANNERNDDFSSVLEQFLNLSSNETTGEHEDKSLVDKYVQKQIKIWYYGKIEKTGEITNPSHDIKIDDI